MKSPKPKKCRVCPTVFEPFNSLQVVCGTPCAIKLVNKNNEKKAKKEIASFKRETRNRKIAMKSKSEWLSEAQTAFNKYVRVRDKGKPCISCDKPDDGSHQRHASHYKSVGSNSALRFNLWNVHASCSQCNNHLSGNIGEYIPRLIKKIGQEKYDWLLTQNQAVKHDIDYIKRLKKIFNKRIRIIESRH